MKFIECPNSPNNATAVLIAKNTPKSVVLGLEKLGITPIFGSEINYKVSAVTCHIDTQICHLGEKDFVVSPHAYKHYKDVLKDANLFVGEKSGTGGYPDDAAYNVANIGKIAIHNFKYTDSVLLEKLKGEKINVGQGYSKCSICIVDENSIITEDEGIANILNEHNINVLKISAGDVLLDGLSYGFLGGASGKIAKDKLAFAGDITGHRDFEKIYNFCMRRNVTPISLSKERLCDIGSIIPVYDKE